MEAWQAAGRAFVTSVAVTLYLAYLWAAGGMSGVLLWPVVILHAILTLLLARRWFNGRT